MGFSLPTGLDRKAAPGFRNGNRPKRTPPKENRSAKEQKNTTELADLLSYVGFGRAWRAAAIGQHVRRPVERIKLVIGYAA